jgi:hypothetical protein
VSSLHAESLAVLAALLSNHEAVISFHIAPSHD